MTQTVPDISPLMPMHQDPLLVLYIDDTTLSSPMCSFSNIERVNILIHLEFSKIADLLAVNKLLLNVQKIMIFHYHESVLTENDTHTLW